MRLLQVNRNSNEFKKLQAEWYEKLKPDFEDIENEKGLKAYAFFEYNKRIRHRIEATTEYYRLATHLLNEPVFKNKKEKTIWELHSEGLSIRDIIKKLKLERAALHTIHRTIIRLRKIMLSKTNEE